MRKTLEIVNSPWTNIKKRNRETEKEQTHFKIEPYHVLIQSINMTCNSAFSFIIIDLMCQLPCEGAITIV